MFFVFFVFVHMGSHGVVAFCGWSLINIILFAFILGDQWTLEVEGLRQSSVFVAVSILRWILNIILLSPKITFFFACCSDIIVVVGCIFTKTKTKIKNEDVPSIPRLVSLAEADLFSFFTAFQIYSMIMAITLGLTLTASLWLLGRVGEPVWRSLSSSILFFPWSYDFFMLSFIWGSLHGSIFCLNDSSFSFPCRCTRVHCTEVYG